MTYGHWGASTSNLYIGGAADDSRFQNGSQDTEWAPIVYHLKFDLTKEELWKI